MKLAKLEEEIKHIANIYFISLRHICSNKLSSGEDDVYSPFYRYYSDVEEAFKRLSIEHKTIINNEYFYDAYKGWWGKFYTEAKFKKVKKNAIKEFVENYYEIH